MIRSQVAPHEEGNGFNLTGEKEGKVLSIQSHTVAGYVGNKSACFPLQLLGLDVDVVNTVQFSNHTGYPSFRGERISAENFQQLMLGLEENQLHQDYSYVLTGYIGSVELLQTIKKTITKFCSASPLCQYVCDPVLGDEGKLYVPEALVQLYRDEVVPLADILTPNQFECEVLTGVKIESTSDAIKACRLLHERGPRLVIISSMTDTESDPNTLQIIASEASHNNSFFNQYKLEIPKLKGYFTGTGDLFTSLLLAWTHYFPQDFPYAVENVVATMQKVVSRTAIQYESLDENCRRDMKKVELKLIQSRFDILNPMVASRAQVVGENLILGFIFDLDGTLTIPGLLRFDLIREKYGLSCSNDILKDIEECAEDVQVKIMKDIELEEEKGTHMMEIQPGVRELLTWLFEKNIKINIATRNTMKSVNLFLEKSQISADIFTRILTRDFDHVKPHPGVARSICFDNNIHPSNVIFVGDSKDDIECAQGAGCSSCLLVNPNNTKLLDQYSIRFPIQKLDELHGIVLDQNNRK